MVLEKKLPELAHLKGKYYSFCSKYVNNHIVTDYSML